MKTITKISLAAALVCGAAMANAEVPSYSTPLPEYPAEDVKSILSDAYPSNVLPEVPGLNFWGAVSSWDYTATADATDENGGAIVVRGMDQKQPADVTETLYEWCAIPFGSGVETKTYTYFHVEVFCNEATDFCIGFNSYYPATVGEVYFPAITREKMTPGKWYAIDFPISDLKYLNGGEETTNWFPNNDGKGANANVLRIGNSPELYDYSGEIYLANMFLFNGEPKYLGGQTIEPQGSGIAAIENRYGFNTFVKDGMLNCRADEAINAINVYSLTGQTVKTMEANNTIATVDLTSLTDGIYVVSAQLANGQTASARFVK